MSKALQLLERFQYIREMMDEPLPVSEEELVEEEEENDDDSDNDEETDEDAGDMINMKEMPQINHPYGELTDSGYQEQENSNEGWDF